MTDKLWSIGFTLLIISAYKAMFFKDEAFSLHSDLGNYDISYLLKWLFLR